MSASSVSSCSQSRPAYDLVGAPESSGRIASNSGPAATGLASSAAAPALSDSCSGQPAPTMQRTDGVATCVLLLASYSEPSFQKVSAFVTLRIFECGFSLPVMWSTRGRCCGLRVRLWSARGVISI